MTKTILSMEATENAGLILAEAAQMEQAPLLTANAVKYGCGESSQLAFRRANWLQIEPNTGSKSDQRRLVTLLAGYDFDHLEQIEKLTALDILYGDLASLTKTDLELLNMEEDSDNLLKSFKCLPNQQVSYDEICFMPESHDYNRRILGEAKRRLMALHGSLLEVCLKMRRQLPTDTVVGEKRFASKFLVEALGELYNAAGTVREELVQLEQDMGVCVKPKRLNEPTFQSFWLYLGSIALSSILGAFVIWKIRRT